MYLICMSYLDFPVQLKQIYEKTTFFAVKQKPADKPINKKYK